MGRDYSAAHEIERDILAAARREVQIRTQIHVENEIN